MQSHERLAAAVEKRRLELGLRWTEVAAAAEISDSALRAIRRGANPPGKLTARRLEDVLRWEHGSIDRILSGNEPEPDEPTPKPEPPVDELYQRILAMPDHEREYWLRMLRAHDEPDEKRETG